MLNGRLISFRSAFVFTTTLLFGGCGGGGDGGTQPSANVASVSVTISASTIAVPGTAQATATPRDAGGAALTGRTITWTSSSNAVATVSSTGLVTAVGPGNATITASSEGKSGDVAVIITPPAVSAITVTLANASISAGSTTQATAVTRDAQANVLTGRTVTWTSSSQGVATVTTSGLVTGVAPGTADITATSEGITNKATVTVTASPGTVSSFTLTRNGVPLDTSNVAGEFFIDATVDVPSGFNGALVLTVDGVEFARQSVTAAIHQSMFGNAQYALEPIADVTGLRIPVTSRVRCNTSQVVYTLSANDLVTASPSLRNANHLARLSLVNAAGTALNARDFAFTTRNADYFVARGKFVGNSATVNGLAWRSGDINVSVLPVGFGQPATTPTSLVVSLADVQAVYTPNNILGIVSASTQTGAAIQQPFTLPKSSLVYESPSAGSNVIIQSYIWNGATIVPSAAEPRLGGNCIYTRGSGLAQPITITLPALQSGCNNWTLPAPLPDNVLTNGWFDLNSIIRYDGKGPTAAAGAFTQLARPQTVGAPATIGANQYGSLNNYFAADFVPQYGIDLSKIVDAGAGYGISDKLQVAVHYGSASEFAPSASSLWTPGATTVADGTNLFFKARVTDVLGNISDVPLTTSTANPFKTGWVPSTSLGVDPAMLRFTSGAGTANYTGIADKRIQNTSSLGSLGWTLGGSGSTAGYPTNAVSGLIYFNNDLTKPVWGESTGGGTPWVIGGTGGSSFASSLSWSTVTQRAQQLFGTTEGYYASRFYVNDFGGAKPFGGTFNQSGTYTSLLDFTKPSTPVITGMGNFVPGQIGTATVRSTDNVDLKSIHLGPIFNFQSSLFLIDRVYVPLSERAVGDGFAGAFLKDHTENVSATVTSGFMFYNPTSGVIDQSGYPSIGLMAQSEDAAGNQSDIGTLFYTNTLPVTKPANLLNFTFRTSNAIGCQGTGCVGNPSSGVTFTVDYISTSATDPMLKVDFFAIPSTRRVVRLGGAGMATVQQSGQQYRYTRTLNMDWSTYCGTGGALDVFTAAYTMDRLYILKNNPFLQYNLVQPPARPAVCDIFRLLLG